MGFFDAVQPPDLPPQRPEREPWMGPPQDLLPGAVAPELLIGVSDEVAVRLGPLMAWPTGLQITLWMVAREEGVHVDPHGSGHRRPAKAAPDVWPPADALRFGVQFSDGRAATNLAMYGRPLSESAAEPRLSPIGGGGGGGSFRYDYWLWPLPPLPALTVVCEWPSWGLAETRTELDLAPVHAAAARARHLGERRAYSSSS